MSSDCGSVIPVKVNKVDSRSLIPAYFAESFENLAKIIATKQFNQTRLFLEVKRTTLLYQFITFFISKLAKSKTTQNKSNKIKNLSMFPNVPKYLNIDNSVGKKENKKTYLDIFSTLYGLSNGTTHI